MYKNQIFREYDIRGVYQTDFDKDFAYQLGWSYGVYLAEQFPSPIKVSVGYDARLSSPEIMNAVVDGFVKSGAEVYRLGLVTTPMSYFSMFHLDVVGGIMVTGSHNPPEYNGFKISKGKTTIFGDEIQNLKSYIDKDLPTSESGKISDYDIATPYVEKHSKEFGSIKNIPIVLDCGNGAAGAIARRLYESVGLKPTILFEEPDGNFPNHHPDPTVEHNTVDMKAKVKETNSVIGIGFDGDADRIGVVSSSGRFVLGDEIMMIIAKDILKKDPGATIIGDVKCSDHLYSQIDKFGGKPIMWKTGHSLIKNKIKEEKSPFGGELSGHIFFSDRNYGYDDAPYAGLRLIEILANSNRSLDQLLEDVPESFSTPEIRLETTESNKITIVEKLKSLVPKLDGVTKVNDIDGVRVSFKNGWGLVRSSNTQPVITIRFEANSEEELQKIQETMMSLVTPLLESEG